MRGIVFEERRFGDGSANAVLMTAGSSRRTLHVVDESDWAEIEAQGDAGLSEALGVAGAAIRAFPEAGQNSPYKQAF